MEHNQLHIFFIIIVAVVVTVLSNPCDDSFNDDSNAPPSPPVTSPFDLDESFYLLRVLRKTFSGEPPRFRSPTASIIHFAGKTSCSYSQNDTSGFPLVYSKSTCKSYLVLNYDPFRIPSTVVEVRCACDHCRSRSATRISVNVCRPIFYYRRMWRRKCNKKTKRYVSVEVLEPLVVGCTCVNVPTEKIHPKKHASPYRMQKKMKKNI